MARAVASEVRAEAARQRITTRELSAKSGVPYSTAYKTLTDSRVVDVEELVKLGEGLGLRAAELMRRAEMQLARNDAESAQ